MSALQSWIALYCALLGSGMLALIWRVARQCLKAIHDVPLIVPLHQQALAAIETVQAGLVEAKAEIVGVHTRLDGIDRQFAEIGARDAAVKRALDDRHGGHG